MLGLMLSAGLLTSCTEDNNEVEEFADWKAVNDKYWTNLYNETKQKIANGDTSWKIILNYSYQNQVHNADGTQTYAPEKHIIVHELEKGKGAGVPLFTDSVHVHYQGRLLPSTTYTSGLIFDSSWVRRRCVSARLLMALPLHFKTCILATTGWFTFLTNLAMAIVKSKGFRLILT